MVKSTTRGKVGNPSKRVGSFYVNQNCISTACPACGKPLWKNLWRLWKTLSYQQDFLLFSFFAFLVEKSAYIHAYSVLRPKTGRVTSPSEGSRYRKNIGEKLSSCKKCCRKPLALSLNCEKFVKNRQRMIWRFRGILERNGNGSSISQYHHTGGCHAGKSRDMRRQHIQASRFISGGNGRPAPPGAGGRRRRPGKTH